MKLCNLNDFCKEQTPNYMHVMMTIIALWSENELNCVFRNERNSIPEKKSLKIAVVMLKFNRNFHNFISYSLSREYHWKLQLELCTWCAGKSTCFSSSPWCKWHTVEYKKCSLKQSQPSLRSVISIYISITLKPKKVNLTFKSKISSLGFLMLQS